ncbi:MAG: SgcJ/EcaC family oxidoreductase [Burkholderiaceae bacterium]
MSIDEEQIRTLVQTWQTATSAGDVDTVLDLMTDDVVFLVPGRPPMRKAEFAALSRVPDGSPRPKFESTSEIQEIHVSGDMAYLWTKLSVTVTPPGASQSDERAGYTLTVFRRVGGKWLLARDANLLSPIQRRGT